MTKAELERENKRLKKEKEDLINTLGKIKLYTSREPLSQREADLKQKHDLDDRTYKWFLCDFHLDRIQNLVDMVMESEGVEKVERC